VALRPPTYIYQIFTVYKVAATQPSYNISY